MRKKLLFKIQTFYSFCCHINDSYKIFSTISNTELLDAQISDMVKVSGTIPSEMEVTLLLYNLFMGWDGMGWDKLWVLV